MPCCVLRVLRVLRCSHPTAHRGEDTDGVVRDLGTNEAGKSVAGVN
jgi:hypothetical protein